MIFLMGFYDILTEMPSLVGKERHSPWSTFQATVKYTNITDTPTLKRLSSTALIQTLPPSPASWRHIAIIHEVFSVPFRLVYFFVHVMHLKKCMSWLKPPEVLLIQAQLFVVSRKMFAFSPSWNWFTFFLMSQHWWLFLPANQGKVSQIAIPVV